MSEGLSKNTFVIGLIAILILSAIINYGISSMIIKQGPQGEPGPQGEQGIQGVSGEQGIQGESGLKGIQGEPGESIIGPIGPQGAKGDPGEDGEVERWLNRLEALNLTFIQDFSQSIEYNISAGTERTWEFLILEYGIIWEAKISFSGEYVSMSHSWGREGERVFVGSSGISLTYTGSADIVYYGRQEYLWGTITVDYYLHESDPNKLWVTGSIMTNLPTISRGADGYIDIP